MKTMSILAATALYMVYIATIYDKSIAKSSMKSY